MLRFFLTAIFVCFLSLAHQLCADLLPSEIAIIANGSSKESRAVAAYYAKIRSIPRDQILYLEMPDGVQQEVLPRKSWDSIRPRIRNWLAQKNLTDKLRCFVTVWGVPLKIGKAQDSPESQKLLQLLQGERKKRIHQINRSFKGLHELAASDPPAYEPVGLTATTEILNDRFREVLEEAQKRMESIVDQDEKIQANNRLRAYFISIQGINGFVSSITAQLKATGGGTNPNLKAQLDFARGQTMGLQEARLLLESAPQSIERDFTVLSMIDRSDGFMGSLVWIKNQSETLQGNESHSSFDSELSLVMWDPYELSRWQPNHLNARFRLSSINNVKKTYMVSRIDTPSLPLTRKMMDTALKIEKEGLKGKVYLDGRGLVKANQQIQPGSHADYDRSVTRAAELLKKYTSLEVIHNNENELFKEGECPDAAIYCGWYSLAKYVDAFDWAPGAVAYHIASSEASTLKSKTSTVWCKRMLEDGVCATLGPVYEPYVVSFPRPEQFFALLLSGRYTLAECYYLTKPFNSWTMTLLGDPLYNPFKNSPQIQVENLDEPLKSFVEGTGT